jgi:hypothetical protein
MGIVQSRLRERTVESGLLNVVADTSMSSRDRYKYEEEGDRRLLSKLPLRMPFHFDFHPEPMLSFTRTSTSASCRLEVIVDDLAHPNALAVKTMPRHKDGGGSHKKIVCGAIATMLQTGEGLYQQMEIATSQPELTASHSIAETHPPSGRNMHRSYVP